MSKLKKLARGVVRVKITGAEPEKMLNFCAESGIDFWDVSPKKDFSICFSVYAFDYPALSAQNGRNGLELKLLDERGGKALRKKLSRRVAFISALVLCLAVLALSSLFVWKIEVSGNEHLTDGEVLRTLSEAGLDYAAFWPALSSDEIKNKVLAACPDISWLTVNVHSSVCEVVIHERVYKPELFDKTEYMDVIAAKSGIIKKISALDGQTKVNVGDTVTKGAVLISGSMESETADERNVHAHGEVLAQTSYELNAVTPLYEMKKADKDGKSLNFGLIIGKKRINFLPNSRKMAPSCDKITKLEYVCLDDVFMLPVGIAHERQQDYILRREKIDEQAAIERMKQTLLCELKARTHDAQILDKSFSVSKDNDKLTVTLRAQCIEDIGVANDRQNDRG